MKRLLSLLMTVVLLLSLFACTNNTPGNHTDKLKIIATIFPQYDFARTIGGQLCDISMLVTPGTETHSFEPTASDIIELSDCDLFICTGGESDSWIDSMLKNINNPDMTVISLMDCIEQEDEHTDHNHSHTDEHVWTSPINAITISEEICKVMCEKDSLNAEIYKENFSSYKEKLTELDKIFRDITEKAPRNTLVFGDRFPLTHFAEEYNLNCYAAFSGCSDDTEASAATVATLIDKVNAENIPVILKIELSSDNIATTIQKETGAQIRTFYSCHNISKDDFENGETYLSLMEKNTETLRAALY